ncbi:MAG: aspartate/glutamate racemase family protein [Trinickia sp.]|uniref:aspartate/glutamate racemase family protein n=1 Tax=Trinickia sp. TaxID=2571163 RepID=UPI003F801CC5
MKRDGIRRFGVIGGLGPLAGADVLFKLMKAAPASAGAGHFDVTFQQHASRGAEPIDTVTTERKLYVFDLMRDFEKRGVTTIVLPCFLSHTFIDELRANSTLEIVDIVEAVCRHIEERFPRARRVGVLASAYTREKRLFERYFVAPRFEVVHPRLENGVDCVNEAVYGADGIKAGNLCGHAVDCLRRACEDLIEQGVDVIVPGVTEIALVAGQLGTFEVPVIDSNLVYARYVIEGAGGGERPAFKVGVVGGVGPAATIDFLGKIVRNTPASRDQDHVKLLVEQNPQIPDRTEHLVADGPDPTIALYATCKKLEEGAADLIAIPCNTAHAFVERIQPYLGIPIVNMLTVTARHLRERYPTLREVGVLATSGTIESGVYREALEAQGLTQVVPDARSQARVMQAIYGEHGVKAGFTDGQCREDIAAAMEALIDAGIEVAVLGCTELPLLLPGSEYIGRHGTLVKLIDPTDVLARQCVAYAVSARAAAGTSSTRRVLDTRIEHIEKA